MKLQQTVLRSPVLLIYGPGCFSSLTAAAPGLLGALLWHSPLRAVGASLGPHHAHPQGVCHTVWCPCLELCCHLGVIFLNCYWWQHRSGPYSSDSAQSQLLLFFFHLATYYVMLDMSDTWENRIFWNLEVCVCGYLWVEHGIFV